MVLARLSDGMWGGMFRARPVTIGLPGLAQNIPLWVLAKKIASSMNDPEFLRGYYFNVCIDANIPSKFT